MDETVLLSAIAADIRATGGKRCKICLNYIAQPFCGMTGAPHVVPHTTTTTTSSSSSSPDPKTQTRRKKRSVAKSAPSRGTFSVSDDVVLVVFAFLNPWEVIQLRVLSKELWAASLHPKLWRAFGTVVEDITLLDTPEAFRSEVAQAVWVRGLQACVDHARSVLSQVVSGAIPFTAEGGAAGSGQHPFGVPLDAPLPPCQQRYVIYAKFGVLGLRRSVAELFPSCFGSGAMKERAASDVLSALLELNLCDISMKLVTMGDIDELHELLSRICDAHQVVSDVYDRLKHKKEGSAVKLAALHSFVKQKQDSINITTKVDQWMNCVTDLRYWEQLRLQYCTLPELPSQCSVLCIMAMLQSQPHFKDLWDFTISKANDAFDSDAGDCSAPFSDDDSSTSNTAFSPPAPAAMPVPVPLMVPQQHPPTSDASFETVLPTSELSA